MRAAAQLMPGNIQLRIETIAGIPLYNGDLEAAEGKPVASLKEAVAAADVAAPRDAGIQQLASGRVQERH